MAPVLPDNKELKNRMVLNAVAMNVNILNLALRAFKYKFLMLLQLLHVRPLVVSLVD